MSAGCWRFRIRQITTEMRIHAQNTIKMLPNLSLKRKDIHRCIKKIWIQLWQAAVYKILKKRYNFYMATKISLFCSRLYRSYIDKTRPSYRLFMNFFNKFYELFLSNQFSFIFQPNNAYNMSFKREINYLNNGVKTNQICQIYFALLQPNLDSNFFDTPWKKGICHVNNYLQG